MPNPEVSIDPHPLLDARLVVLTAPQPLAAHAPSTLVTELLHHRAAAPLSSDDGVRAHVRDLLRHAGFKPTGRSKPSSEYLLKASEDGRLAPINVLVDLGNAVSLHSGLPISVVDLDRVVTPLRIAAAAGDAHYVFNASGQEIDVAKLLCLHDAEGPCANAVKDAQRTKTSDGTTRALAIVWGTRSLPGRTQATVAWLIELATSVDVKACSLNVPPPAA